MRKYEICIIIDPDVDDRQVNALIEKSLARFKTDGGIVGNVEVAGRRRLAYEIDKKAEGTYVFAKVTSEPAVVKELNRLFTLNESILRTKVFRDDSKKAAANPKREMRMSSDVTAPAKEPKPSREGRGAPRGDRPSGPRSPRPESK
jgi:small subunit ribosomal protein S6